MSLNTFIIIVIIIIIIIIIITTLQFITANIIIVIVIIIKFSVRAENYIRNKKLPLAFKYAFKTSPNEIYFQ